MRTMKRTKMKAMELFYVHTTCSSSKRYRANKFGRASWWTKIWILLMLRISTNDMQVRMIFLLFTLQRRQRMCRHQPMWIASAWRQKFHQFRLHICPITILTRRPSINTRRKLRHCWKFRRRRFATQCQTSPCQGTTASPTWYWIEASTPLDHLRQSAPWARQRRYRKNITRRESDWRTWEPICHP